MADQDFTELQILFVLFVNVKQAVAQRGEKVRVVDIDRIHKRRIDHLLRRFLYIERYGPQEYRTCDREFFPPTNVSHISLNEVKKR